jgi:SAM-dependent methyltransferase
MQKPILSMQEQTSWADEASLKYHLKQYEEVKESTQLFLDFIKNNVVINSNNIIIDLGCGAGGATKYISANLPQSEIIGIDSSPELIDIANSMRNPNCFYQVGDFLNLHSMDSVQGVYSIHTLMCLPEFQQPVEQVLTKLKPHWFAISSLFYRGEIQSITILTENKKNRSVYYNTYSIPELNRFVNRFGYSVSSIERFDISFDLPPIIDSDFLGTYTVALKENEDAARLQISGPMLMNWYFVLISKN